MLAPAIDQTSGQSAGLDRHYSLDLIRGLAACAVVTYHYLLWFQDVTVESLGTFSVYLFFVLSGLTMTMVYGRTFTDGITPADAARFYRKRFARLFPLLAAVSLAYLILAFRSPHFGELAVKTFLTASGLFSAHVPVFVSIGTGTWTLAIEVSFYAVFPLVAMAAMRASLGTLLFVVAFLLLGQNATLYLLRGLDGAALWQTYTMPLTFAPFFAIGVLLYSFGDRRIAGGLLAALAALGILLMASLAIPGELFKNHSAYLALTMLASAVIALAYRSVVPQWLRAGATFIGDISYALYLTHPLTYIVVLYASGHLGLSTPMQSAIFFSLSVVVAYATFILLERPARAWIAR